MSRLEINALKSIPILMIVAIATACGGYQEPDKPAEPVIILRESHYDPRPETAMQDTLMSQLLPAVEKVESHGDLDAVSRKGARGLYQIMPDTAKDPGFGVRKMHGHTIKEQNRFTRDSFTQC